MKNSAKMIYEGPFEAEFSIKHSMFCFPAIFATRQHVIDQYFLVIGNAMEWVDGGLAHEELDGDDVLFYTRTVAEMMREGKPDAEIWEVVRARGVKRFGERPPMPNFEDLKKKMPELARDIEKIYKPALPPKPTPFKHAYPICEYSRLMTVPKNVKPDWWVLWKEALEIAKTVPVCADGDAETKRIQKKRQKEWIKKAEKRARDLGLYKRHP